MRVQTLLPASAIVAVFALLAACEQEPLPEQAQRSSMEAAAQRGALPLPSPDTTKAIWRVAADGQAINFGVTPEAALLTLACGLEDNPPQLRVIRHVPARPGQTALFPVIGNGRISRLPLDAQITDGEWRWEGSFPASDEQMDVFAGPRDIEATLPGGGTLMIAASSIPGEFVNWCRAGGNEPEQPADEPETTSAPPAQ